jgi:hypothetical protein
MKIIRRSLALFALLALVLWLWSALFPGPERIIRQQLARVAQTASFTASEGLLARAHNASKLAGYFSVDAQVSLDASGHGSYTFNGRNEIMQAAAGARSAGGALAVEFLDVAVVLAADRLSATADLTAKAKIPGERDFYVQEVKFILKKIDGDWLIVRVETVKTLSHGRLGEVGRVTPCAPPPVIATASGAHGVTPPNFRFVAGGCRSVVGLGHFR